MQDRECIVFERTRDADQRYPRVVCVFVTQSSGGSNPSYATSVAFAHRNFLLHAAQSNNNAAKFFASLMQNTLAAVTSGLLTIVKTGLTFVSYFGNVTASLFALTIIRTFTPRWSKTIQTNYSYIYPSGVRGLVLSLQTNNQCKIKTKRTKIYIG